MTHKKNSNNSGRMIVAGIVILGGILYIVSSGNLFARNRDDSNITTNANNSCPMKNTQGGGGCGGAKTATTTTQTTSTTVDTTTSYETINVGHSAYALEPETVNLVAGKSYKVIITPSADGGGCMNNMTIPGLDSNVYPVKKGVPVTIVINNAKAGTYEVVCGNMGMHQGNIVVQ